jgi:3-oxoacyl-[acyl-carrier-protein] synthase-3
MSNRDLEELVDTSDEWIFSRTGIRERRLAADDESTSVLAARAAEAALERAGVRADELEMILVATITPDMLFPSTACLVQDLIGAKNAVCMDIEAACSGFLYVLETARQYIATGSMDRVLVIGAEKLSSFIDWTDRTTCVLFGDGAGAAVLGPQDSGRGIMASVMGSDGGLAHLLRIPGGGSRRPPSREMIDRGDHYLRMEGREVFKHAVRCMCDASQRVLEKVGMTMDDVACVIPHQANMRIMKAVAARLDVPIDRFYLNVEQYGNMSAASAAVALDEAIRKGVVKPSDIVLMVVFGGGFTWGATLLEL